MPKTDRIEQLYALTLRCPYCNTVMVYHTEEDVVGDSKEIGYEFDKKGRVTLDGKLIDEFPRRHEDMRGGMYTCPDDAKMFQRVEQRVNGNDAIVTIYNGVKSFTFRQHSDGPWTWCVGCFHLNPSDANGTSYCPSCEVTWDKDGNKISSAKWLIP